MDLYIHFPIRLRGIMLNWLSTGTTLPYLYLSSNLWTQNFVHLIRQITHCEMTPARTLGTTFSHLNFMIQPCRVCAGIASFENRHCIIDFSLRYIFEQKVYKDDFKVVV
jgi:hypothetical protein